MAKTRLNQAHREMLLRFATDNLSCPAEEKARAKAYERASRLVRDAVEKRFPSDDMAVLTKYNCSYPDACIRGGSPSGQFVGFQFDKKEDAPIVPDHGCSSRSIGFTQATVDAIEAFEKANNLLKDARQKKIDAYRTLIGTARSFEEITAVWSAAEALAEKIVARTTALIALSPEVVEFIRDDNAGALAQAA
jgi:hypothetical protein